MKVAIVVYSHYSRDARVRRYAESLFRNGFEVDIICLKENYRPIEENISLIMYPIPRIRSGRIWYILEYLLFLLYSFFKLTINYFRYHYQIIHINNMPEILVFSTVIPKVLGAKIILDMHDPMPELYMSKYHTKENDLLVTGLKWLESLSFTFADKILTANDTFKTLFLKRHKIPVDKISVILNCPDTKIFNRQQKTDNKKQFTLFYMGTVEKRFGLDLVLEAVPKLIKDIPNLRFQIIPKLENEGKYFMNFKFQISNFKLEKYIKILSPQSLENIAKYIKLADIGVVLAQNGVFTENIFPVKLLEFIQMGIPVIATKTKVLSTYFKDDQLYFLPKNTPAEFTRAVIDLYKDKKLRKNLTKNAKKYLKEYNWKNEEMKYRKIIKEITN